MNYHNDEWIMEGLQRHYDQIKKIVPEERIIAVTLIGSQNYGLDHEGSDIDSTCIFIPSEYELQLYPTWMDKVMIELEYELVYMIDIRLFVHGLEKRSLYFFERMYTPWQIVNPKYQHIWQQFLALADNIVDANKPAMADSIKFYMNLNIDHVTQNFRETHKQAAVKYGYDNKILAYNIRYYLLLKLLLTDYPFKESLHPVLNSLAADAKNGAYNMLEVLWLTRFLNKDFIRLHQLIHDTYSIDEEKNTKLLIQLKELEKKVLYDYYGERLSTLLGGS